MRTLFSVPVRLIVGTLAALLAIASGSTPTSAQRFDVPRAIAGDDLRATRAATAYATLPVAFVENRGQIDARVRYYAQGPRYAFYVTRDEVVLSFLDSSAQGGQALALRFPGSNPRRTIAGDERAAGEVNYFHGQDPSRWQTGIARYAEVAYRELWRGIDLQLREQGGTLKYEFRVAAGANPSAIRLAYAGATRTAIDDTGALAIETAMGTLRDAAPVSYQIVDGRRVPVESRWVAVETANGAREYGFAMGAGYQPGHALVIDPGVEYSTFLGGSSHETVGGIKVDAAGNAYVMGTTQSPDFPTTAGAFKRTGAASNFGDVFVTKLNAAGSALIYSTFIGGNDFDFGRGLAIDAAGNAYITGQTKSPSFPTTGGAFDRTFNVDSCPRCGIDQYDAFVTKLNASGSALVYSTFLGGFDIDDGMGIAVDGAGNAYVTGETGSSNFPVTAGAFDTTKNGSFDAFVTKLNATGSALVYSTYLGGSAVEYGSRLAIDAGGNAYVVGSTSSTDLPTTAGAFDTTQNGAFDAFVTKLNAAGSALVYSTFLGGDGFDGGGNIVLDASNNAYVVGGSGSRNFPTTPGAFDSTPDDSDAFVTKLNAAGSALIYSTVLGGSASEGAGGIVLDTAGNAWITGGTNSVDFPVTSDAADVSFNGVSDVFVAELSADGSNLLYGTYLGGAQGDGGSEIARDASGDIYVAGNTFSLDFPTTAGALDIVFGGDLSIFWGDAFVTKLAIDTGTSAPPSTPPVPGAPTLTAPANNATTSQPFTFDWNDVAGAASYTIQVDENTNFTAPIERNVSVTLSNYVGNGLAAGVHFWRVRAVNTAGVAGAWSATRSFTAQAPPPPPVLSTFTTNPSTVVGGNASSGTVVFSAGAPEGGALVTLTSSNPSVVTVPASVLAPSNSFTGTFAFSTSTVTTTTVVTITAAYNGTTRTATVTVTPSNAEPLPTLVSLAISPSSVSGGSTAVATVTLSGAAPAGGATVSLASGNAAVASGPAAVTVSGGTTTATFTVSTATVSTTTGVSFLASYNGSTRSATITVTAVTTPPPPQTATLTVSATGRNGERVTSSPSGINVSTGTTGSASFTTGTSLTLSVSNGRDAIWSGACSSGGSKRKTCTFTLSATATVTANVQ